MDCADPGCTSECDEIGTDEADNDGDGDVDCDDLDCDGRCPERCHDLRDNDGDGLLDCEDDDCLTDAACFESSCADGNDNDNDGLMDCADEDCWGNGCAVTAVATTGAAQIVRSVNVEHISGSQCASPAVGSSWTSSVHVQSPTGTVRTLGASSTAWASCNWNASNIQLTSVGAVNIAGMAVASGCGLSASSTAFLPQELVSGMPDIYMLDAAAVDSMGALWFDGSSVGNPSIVSSSYSFGVGGGCLMWDRTVRMDSVVDSVSGGDEAISTSP